MEIIKDILIYTPMYVTLFWAIVLLLSNRQKYFPKFFLGIFMSAAFLVYLSHAIFFKGLKHLYLYVDVIYIFASLMVYPLYYIYIKLLSVRSDFNKKDIRIFIPAFLLASLSLVFYLLMTSEEQQNYIQDFLFDHQNFSKGSVLQKSERIIFYLSRIIFSVQVIYFLIKGSRYIREYNSRISNFYANTEDKTIIWVQLLLWSFVATSAMSIVFNIIGRTYFYKSVFLLVIPSLVFSILLFTIGLQGFMQNYSIRDLQIDEMQDDASVKMNPKKTNLKEELTQLFQKDKIYRNPELKITDVSNMLHSNRTYLSHFINQEFHFSFSDYVAKYRISEAKELLIINNDNPLTLEYISEKVGFGSIHSFIRVFKKMEKCTPGTYRKNMISQIS